MCRFTWQRLSRYALLAVWVMAAVLWAHRAVADPMPMPLDPERPTEEAQMQNKNKIFPIMAWEWMPNDPDVIKEVAACGFNIAGFATPQTLDLVHEAGMYAFVTDPRLSQHDWRHVDAPAVQAAIGEVIAEVGKHPAVFGYYIKDEPHVDEFAGLEVAAETVHRLAPGSWPYINLFPDYAVFEQLGTATYAEYLERFITTCHPHIVSYDNYSLMEYEDVRMAYWTNLSAMRAASAISNISPRRWATTAWDPSTSSATRRPPGTWCGR